MALRVIVGYTGSVGSAAIKLLRSNPAFELVGVLVHSSEKEGQDVGDIVGIAPTGVFATRDVEALVALKADVLSWHGLTWDAGVKAKFLRAGTNVYTGMGGWFLPGEPDHELIEQAGAEGGAALIAGGNIPGLISDVLPLFASGYSANVTFVRAWQRNHVPGYPSAFQLGHHLGFGQEVPPEPLDPNAPLSQADAGWLWGIGQSAQLIARGLGIAYDGVRLTNKEYGRSSSDVVLQPSGLAVKKGSIAGTRWTFTAYSGGKPFYELVNEQTAELGLGDGWRQSEDEPNWRVVIEGSPSIEVVFGVTSSQPHVNHAAALNAARAVNMLPRIVATTRTGWCSVLDVPAAVGMADAGFLS
jgi:hypothetical protein